MNRFISLVWVLLAVFAVAGCTTTQLEANTDYDSSFDFSGVKKIAIQPVERMNDAAIMISDMDVNRLNRIFGEQLTAKGFQMVTDNNEADMHLTWHLVTQEKTDVRSYNSMSYYNCWRCGPTVSDVSVRQYTVGTLIVDMIDPGRGQSVWRSMVQSRINPTGSGGGDDELSREAGRALFVDFPPY